MIKYIIFAVSLLFATQLHAAITFTNGKWETTFDCAETEVTGKSANICDGLAVEEYLEDIPERTLITSSANNSNGSGGLGYRHFLSGSERNKQSINFRANFPSSTNEVWVRFYARWQTGFAWAGIENHKMLYFRSSAVWYYLNLPHGPDNNLNTIGVNVNGLGPEFKTTSAGWNSSQGGTTADGNWDCFEIYTKINSSVGVGDGIIRIWINGIRVYEKTDMDFGNVGSRIIEGVYIGSNHDTADNPSNYYEDFDDVAIALPAYPGFVQDSFGNNMIGPLGAPAAPLGGKFSNGLGFTQGGSFR